MDPATTFCPHLACAARGQTGQGNIGIHSCKDKRLLCTACHKTCSATQGTAFYRLRTPADTVALVLTLLAHGCPLQAIVVAFGFDERTVAAWGRETFREPVHPGQGGRPRLRRWRHILIAQVVKRYERRRVIETERRLIDGTPARVETLRRRSQGEGVINTAYSERLHATFRERLAALTRRGRALARHTLTLQHGMYLIGTVYNFCTPHASLAHAGRGDHTGDGCWYHGPLLDRP